MRLKVHGADARRAARVSEPRYSEGKGWTGGDTRTLYAITDVRTGNVTVRPGKSFAGVGPACTIRIATRLEAETEWQSPLHAGWKVAP